MRSRTITVTITTPAGKTTTYVLDRAAVTFAEHRDLDTGGRVQEVRIINAGPYSGTVTEEDS